MNDEYGRVTGRQVLLDAVTFAKDVGAYIFELSKRVFNTVRNALKSDGDSRETAAAPID